VLIWSRLCSGGPAKIVLPQAASMPLAKLYAITPLESNDWAAIKRTLAVACAELPKGTAMPCTRPPNGALRWPVTKVQVIAIAFDSCTDIGLTKYLHAAIEHDGWQARQSTLTEKMGIMRSAGTHARQCMSSRRLCTGASGVVWHSICSGTCCSCNARANATGLNSSPCTLHSATGAAPCHPVLI
jgi:hypothetical protein